MSNILPGSKPQVNPKLEDLAFVTQDNKPRNSTLQKIKNLFLGTTNMGTTATTVTGAISEVNSQLNAMAYEVAGGTATAITLNMPATLKDGYWKKFIAKADNGGVATTINGKPFYKVCSTNPPNLKKDRPYEAYYNLTGDCFFLKASATGTTTADKVLANETFSTENDTDLVGTMPNRGAVTATLNSGGSYTIPAGYHNGQGKVTANSLASQTQANADASKILSGYSAWVNGVKVNGNATIQSLGGFQIKSETYVYVKSNSTGSFNSFSVTSPSTIKYAIVYCYDSNKVLKAKTGIVGNDKATMIYKSGSNYYSVGIVTVSDKTLTVSDGDKNYSYYYSCYLFY